MPRATKRVFKKHTGHINYNTWPSTLGIIAEPLNPASKNEDILPRKVLPPRQYRSFLMSKCCLDSKAFILLRFRFCCLKYKTPFSMTAKRGPYTHAKKCIKSWPFQAKFNYIRPMQALIKRF
jgi:hypothetical protein